MKKSILTTILCFYSVVILFSLSCNKKDYTIERNFQKSTKDLLLNYLNQQKIIEFNSSLFIDTLISKSEWNNISETSLSKDVKLIYVPLTYNRNSNRIGMTFLFDNKKQNIYYSLITEIPKKQSITSNTKNSILNRPVEINIPLDDISPINVISSFYKNNMNGFTGSLKAFSLTNHFLWEYGYQNGNKYYEKLITHTNVSDQSKISTPKLSSPKISNSVESNTKKSSRCDMWFLVTYYNDGSFDREYLGTTCYNDCEQTTIGISEESDIIKSYCSGIGNPGPGGGSGGNDPIDEIINNIGDPCLKQLVINLKNANKLTNKISSILENVFGEKKIFNLTFRQDDNLIDDKTKLPILGKATKSRNFDSEYYVTLNNAELKRFSQEYQTLVIMHEVLHDYFHAEKFDTIPNGHTRMMNDYIYKMSSSLDDLYPHLKNNPNLSIALCFMELRNAIGTDKLQHIKQSDFDAVLNKFASEGRLDLNNWERIGGQAAFAGKEDSPLGTPPCNNVIIN